MANGFAGGNAFSSVLGGFAQGISEARRREEERKQQEFMNALRMAAERRAQEEAGRARELHPIDVEGRQVGVERDRLGIEDTQGDIAAEKRKREASETLAAQVASDPNMTPVQKQLAIAQIYSGQFPAERLDPYGGKSREEHLADLEAEEYHRARGRERGAPPRGEGDGKEGVDATRRRTRTNVGLMSDAALQEELGKALQIANLASQGRAEPLTQEEIVILEELRAEAERRQKRLRGGGADNLDFSTQ